MVCQHGRIGLLASWPGAVELPLGSRVAAFGMPVPPLVVHKAEHLAGA
jgi:hypothetical protein